MKTQLQLPMVECTPPRVFFGVNVRRPVTWSNCVACFFIRCSLLSQISFISILVLLIRI